MHYRKHNNIEEKRNDPLSYPRLRRVYIYSGDTASERDRRGLAAMVKKKKRGYTHMIVYGCEYTVQHASNGPAGSL